MLAWVMVRAVESGLSCDILRDAFVALSIDIFSINVLMSLTLCPVVEKFLVVFVNLVSISWMRVFVLSDWLENSIWFDSRTLSLFSCLIT